MKTSKIIFLLLFVFIFQHINAHEKFIIQEDFKKINFKNYISVYETLDSINPNILIENKKLNWEKNKVSYGFSNNFFWLKFTLKNDTFFKKNLNLEVDNPHLRFIEFYEVKENSLVLKHKCGRFMHFDARPIDNVDFLFPIEVNANEESTYFLKIDKRTSSVSFPIYLWEQNEFTKENNKSTLFRGIYFGGVLLAIFYSLIAFFYLKRNLYLNYFFYVVFVGLYMFTSAGYSFQYIAKNAILFNNYFRVITLVLMMFFHTKFLQSLLRTKIYAPRNHRFLNFGSCLLLVITVLWICLKPFNLTQIYLKSAYLLIIILLIGFLFACYITYNKMKKIVKLYIFSFSGIIFSAIIVVLFEFGLFVSLRSVFSPLYVGSFIEIVILSVVLISEMQSILKEKENLSIKIVEKQQEIVQAYIEGIEKEKIRISQELHDDIGSKLSNLNQFVASENVFSTKARNRLEEVINDVRNISHKLTPNNKTLFSFKEQIQNIVEEALVSTNIKYNLNLPDDYSTLNDNQKLNIYRIVQEFLHNAIKHSKANKIEIEISKLDTSLIITIEDNGVGFNVDEQENGLGLINIRKRVDYLKGTIELSSILEKGTFVLITIPIN